MIIDSQFITNYGHFRPEFTIGYKQVQFHHPVKWFYLGEAATVLGHDVRVRAFQFPDDLKALVELGEDVHHRAGEQSMLRCLLELRQCRVARGKTQTNT